MKKEIKAFTLVELLVSVSIFIIFVSLASTIFVSSLKTQNKVNHLVELADNSGVVLEQIMRDIRSGYDFYGNLSQYQIVNAENTSTLIFKDVKDRVIQYKLVEENGVKKIVKIVNFLKEYDFTPKEVKINYLYFTVKQNHICYPWRVTINLNIGSANQTISQNFDLQTTISSRILPIDKKPNLNCQ